MLAAPSSAARLGRPGTRASATAIDSHKTEWSADRLGLRRRAVLRERS
jgi:hypothetical protein